MAERELVALRAKHFWFAPESVERGELFTIGRTIHSSRGVGFVDYVGGVAVFREALSAKEVLRLAGIASALIPGYRAGTSWAKLILLTRHDF